MCGLFGFVNAGTPYQRQLMALMSRERGAEGTGIAWLDPKKGNWLYKKKGDDVHDLLLKGWSHNTWSQPTLLGHVRAASMGLMKEGGQCDLNSHPFRRNDIILAHNGFISNWKELADGFKNKDFYVDSDVLSAIISVEGIKGLAESYGRASIWWSDIKDTTKFYLWCWKQDLAIGYKPGAFVFASDKKYMRSAGFEDEGFKTETVDENKGIIYKVNTVDGSFEIVDTVKGKETIIVTPTAATVIDNRNTYDEMSSRFYWDNKKKEYTQLAQNNRPKQLPPSSMVETITDNTAPSNSIYMMNAEESVLFTEDVESYSREPVYMSSGEPPDRELVNKIGAAMLKAAPTTTDIAFNLAPWHFFRRMLSSKALYKCSLCNAPCNTDDKCHVCGSVVASAIATRVSVCAYCGMPRLVGFDTATVTQCPKCSNQLKNNPVIVVSDASRAADENKKMVAAISLWADHEKDETQKYIYYSIPRYLRGMYRLAFISPSIRSYWLMDTIEDGV